MNDEPAIMTVREVAKYLRLSEAKVYRLVNDGLLPVVRLGKTWRFRKDLLDEWLAERSRDEMHVTGQSPLEVQAHPDHRQGADDEGQEGADGME